MLAVNAAQLRGWLSRIDNRNSQGEYYLTDIIALAVESGVREIEGVNNRVQLAELERVFQQRQAKRLMLEGVTLRDPARFDLRGSLKVGRDVEIDIEDVVLGSDVRIEANSILDSSILGNHCLIGPFARLRPDCRLADNVKVGNFVEVKKSTVDKGSKINHLTYVGDTRMGANVNVGAGTITCNYDGINKHRTVIGDDVFIGSDTQLVAPVTIGDGATIGAGSTITRNTPAGELTLSRSEQKTRKGWKRPLKTKR